jgi:hypothetical protein
MRDTRLQDVIEAVLHQLEADGEIVLCSPAPRLAVQRLTDAVLDVVPSTSLSPEEMGSIRALILEAVGKKSSFDWEREMPTLTGLTAEGFAAVAEKLPRPC